jgi:hypothetical protein
MEKLTQTVSGMTDLRVVSPEDRQLLRLVKSELLPEGFEGSDEIVPHTQIGHAGFELNVDQQLTFLKSLQQPEFQELFAKLRNHPEINTQPGDSTGFIRNGFYPTPDAEIYAAMIATRRPKTILEVGSGYSTVIARTTVDHFKLDTEIRVIDPQPRREIEAYVDHVEYERVENSALVSAERMPDDLLLFIDSSHVCRYGGDMPFLFCRVLPALTGASLIHIHDIYTPYDYPGVYVGQFYNEQYLLQTLLANSDCFRTRFATHYMARQHTAAMEAAFGVGIGDKGRFFGASYWFERGD